MKTPVPNTGRMAAILFAFFLFGGFTQHASAQRPFIERGVPFSVYLEAECALIGDNWRTVEDTLASGGNYVVIKDGFSSIDTFPEDIPANRVSFSVFLQEEDDIYLSARVRSLSPATDSYWVRVAGGDWVKWNSGLRLETNWVWRSVVNSPFVMPAGEVIIDFAFREPDTRLDKIYLSSNRASPTMLGGFSINCDDTTQCAAMPERCKDEIWIEAECGDIGSSWSYVSNAQASSGGYLAFTGPTKLTAPDANASRIEDYLTFESTLATAGTYNLYFRLNAINAGQNSFYVQVDQGEWFNFSTDSGGSPLSTEGFEWRRFNSDGNKVGFGLAAGMHTIRVAGREASTQLDKVFLGISESVPTGYGKVQLNCKASATTPTREARLNNLEVSVFPNPVVDQLNVQLPELSGGPVWIDLLDGTGRVIKQLNYVSGAGNFSQFIPVGDLPAGLYHVAIRTDKGRASRSFVKR